MSNENDEISSPAEVVIREKTSLLKKSKSKNSIDEQDAEHQVNSLTEINNGDHLIIAVNKNSYCHVILEKVDPEKETIDIIYYDDTKTQCSLDEYMINERLEEQSEAEPSCKKIGVKKSTILINLKIVELYKVDYGPNECLMPDETIAKARMLSKYNYYRKILFQISNKGGFSESFIGQSKYNIFANNDEHFAIYCKTGKAAKLFVINPKDLTPTKIMGKSIQAKIAGNLAQEGGQVLLVNTAKHIATKFPRSAVAGAAPAAAEAVGSLLGAGIEGASLSYDIYKKHKDLKSGKINDVKFKKYIAKRVTRGVNSVAGGVAGGVIGQLVIPIPVVGAVVGGLVGGIVGAVVGQGEGILLGELVEVIDTKIKEKKASNQASKETTAPLVNLSDSSESIKKEIDKTEPEVQLNEVKKFHVVDKLVLKFDKDLLKSENFAHLLKEKPEENPVIIDASSKINDEDYEIYVLNDSNEILTELNKIEMSINDNGAINKRASLEAFTADQLPSNINVFLKIAEE